MNRWGEFSPLWQNLKVLNHFLKVLHSIWQKIYRISFWYLESFHCFKWPNIEQIIHPSALTASHVCGLGSFDRIQQKQQDRGRKRRMLCKRKMSRFSLFYLYRNTTKYFPSLAINSPPCKPLVAIKNSLIGPLQHRWVFTTAHSERTQKWLINFFCANAYPVPLKFGVATTYLPMPNT